MSCETIATIHRDEGVRFDDLEALNAELMAQSGISLAELYEDRSARLPSWAGPFSMPEGALLIADAEEERRCVYGTSTQVWACWSRQVTEAVARHLVAGEIVVEIREEGQPFEYIVITPGAFDVRDDA